MNRHSLILERLDRCIANNSWIRLFPEASITHLPRTHSDHCHLLLSLGRYSLPFSQKLFRMESMWCSHPFFIDLVRNSFNPFLSMNKDISFEWVAKTWNRKVFGNIFQKKKNTLARLASIQRFQNYAHNHFLHFLEVSL